MVVLSVENLSKAYGDRLLFDEVTFAISRDDRVGLIGVNGSGKSTLLRILDGQEAPDDGRVARANDARIEFLDQDPDLDSEQTALEAVLAGGPEAFAVVDSYERACRRLAENPEDSDCIDEMSRLSEEMDRVGGWNLETEARTILTKLGMGEVDKLVGAMSGGQKKRVALARALLRPSDLLILDEPTNHLDVEVVAWLEGYLARRTSGLLLITHDRYFLDRVTNLILELEDETIYRHRGNYSDFLEARERRREDLKIREQKRASLAKKELEWLRRGPKARGTKAKARVQRAHELLDSSYAVDESSVEIDTVERRLGKKVIVLDEVKKRRGDQQIIGGFSYRLARRDRLGIVGPNGVGKSTLLDLVAGRLEADEGLVERGETVVIGYYDQTSESLDGSLRVHDYITEVAHRVPTSDGWLTASQMLELFLFDKHKQWTFIEKLSGGERRRLYLLRVLMGQPNILLLDEPTNDLDVDTLTVLEDYLDEFEGAVIAVSHDRYFLDRTMEHLLYFRGGGVIEEIPGNYSYLEQRLEQERREQAAEEARQRSEQEAKASEPAASASKKPRKITYREEKELEGLDEKVAALEERLSEIDEEFVAKAADYEAVAALDEEKQRVEAQLEAAVERWMELSELAEQG